MSPLQTAMLDACRITLSHFQRPGEAKRSPKARPIRRPMAILSQIVFIRFTLCPDVKVIIPNGHAEGLGALPDV